PKNRPNAKSAANARHKCNVRFTPESGHLTRYDEPRRATARADHPSRLPRLKRPGALLMMTVIERCRRSLLRIDAGGLDQRPPLLDLGPLECAERLWRLLLARRNVRAPPSKPRAHGGISERIDDGAVELGNYGLGRVLRRPQAEPDRGIEPRQPALVDGRNFGRRGKPRLGGDAIGLELAAAHLRQRARGLVEHEIDLPRDQVLQHLRRAAVGHELEILADSGLEIDCGEVRWAAWPRIADRHLVGVCLEPCDQLAQIL